MDVIEANSWAVRSSMSGLMLTSKKWTVRSLHYTWEELGIWSERELESSWPWKPGVQVASAVKWVVPPASWGECASPDLHSLGLLGKHWRRGGLRPWSVYKSSLQKNSERTGRCLRRPPEKHMTFVKNCWLRSVALVCYMTSLQAKGDSHGLIQTKLKGPEENAPPFPSCVWAENRKSRGLCLCLQCSLEEECTEKIAEAHAPRPLSFNSFRVCFL